MYGPDKTPAVWMRIWAIKYVQRLSALPPPRTLKIDVDAMKIACQKAGLPEIAAQENRAGDAA